MLDRRAIRGYSECQASWTPNAGEIRLKLDGLTGLPYGLVVRIPAFHAGGPGSIPGVGTSLCTIIWILGLVWQMDVLAATMLPDGIVLLVPEM